jgi:hypothetical protein
VLTIIIIIIIITTVIDAATASAVTTGRLIAIGRIIFTNAVIAIATVLDSS